MLKRGHPMKLLNLTLRTNSSRVLCAFFTAFVLISASARIHAQAAGANASMPSPPATASATVAGGTIDVKYNAPHLRGRHVGGPEIVPYGQVWRTGANPATTLITSVPLMFGTLLVPAGTHTIYTLPTADSWQLIINKQTGQWGTEYKQDMDLGRIPMQAKPMSAPQEAMSITFENTTANSTELH